MIEQRSQLFIKHNFQKSMILEILMITFTLINILVVAAFLLLDYVPNLHQKKEYIALAVVVFEIIGFLLVYRMMIRSSHRIAGPLFNLERNMQAIENGDLSFNMDIRSDDQFHELSDQMNNTVESLRTRIQRIQSLAVTVQQKPGNTKACNELISELEFFKTIAEANDDTYREVA